MAGVVSWYDCTATYIFDDSFLCAYNVAVFEDVLGKVDVGWSTAMFDLLDGLFDVSLRDGHGGWKVFGAGFK